MRVLLTGATGFLGSHVLPRLLEAGHDVVATFRRAESEEPLRSSGAEPVFADLDLAESVDDAFRRSGAAALVNVASLGFGHAPTVIAAAEDAGIRRAVFVSTTAIFTKLNAPSKRLREAAETAIRESALDWTILRPTMIYGTPRDRNMVRLLQLLRKSPVVPIPGRGLRLQQPVHVDDVADAITSALAAEVSVRNAYDIAGPAPQTFREVIDQAAASLGRRPLYVPLPLGPLIWLVRAYEKASRRPRLKAEQVERLAEDKAFDIGPAQRDLAYAPRPFSTGISQEALLLKQ